MEGWALTGLLLGEQILEYQSDAVDSAAVADAWLNSLPLTVDEVEAQGSHALLVRLIEQSDPRYDPRPPIAGLFHTSKSLAIRTAHLFSAPNRSWRRVCCYACKLWLFTAMQDTGAGQ